MSLEGRSPSFMLSAPGVQVSPLTGRPDEEEPPHAAVLVHRRLNAPTS